MNTAARVTYLYSDQLRYALLATATWLETTNGHDWIQGRFAARGCGTTNCLAEDPAADAWCAAGRLGRGTVDYRYCSGTKLPPVLESLPRLLYRHENLITRANDTGLNPSQSRLNAAALMREMAVLPADQTTLSEFKETR